jgi:eukaryotic-like serine/threonine-protein kinase
VSTEPTEVLPPGEPPPGPPYEPLPSRRFGWGLALGLLMVLIAGVGALAGYVVAERSEDTTTVTRTVAAANSSEEVQVPDVVGLEEDEAVVRLADAGFQTQDRFKPSSKPTGAVLEQEPAAGSRAPKGSTVVLVVDRGATRSATVAVPSVIGERVSEAQEKLRAAGLESSVFVVPSSEPRGQVIAQAPKAGEKAERRTPVRLNVSAGTAAETTPATTTPAPTTPAPTTATTTAEPAVVPDVVGLSETEARQQLTAAGLRASVVRVPSAEPEGTVVAQARPPGTSLRRGSQIQINVSTGTA